MNKILISNGKAVSSVLSESDAIKRLSEYKKYFDVNAYLIDTDQKVNEKPIYAPAEEVEDVGCAGGACTL